MTIVALSTSLLLTFAPGEPPTTAQPATTPVYVDMAEFDAAMQVGQAYHDAGDFLSAARTWHAAAERLPRTADQRGNIVAAYARIAEAYDRAVAQTDDPAVIREALAVLDAHVVQFESSYPDAPVPARLESIRTGMRLQRRTLDAGQVVEGPDRGPTDFRPAQRPWRPMAIGGAAVLTGGIAMAAVFAVGLARQKQYENGLQSAALGCQVNAPGDACAASYGQYRAASSMVLTGMIAAPALLGAGVGMLVVAVKRKRAAEQPIAPLFAPGFVGLGWQRRF